MSKRVYISTDYSSSDGDTDVVKVLHNWANYGRRLVEFTDTAQVASGNLFGFVEFMFLGKRPDARAKN